MYNRIMKGVSFLKCIFIYNPVSGRGVVDSDLGYVIKMLHKKYDRVDVFESKSPDDVTNIARNACLEYDAIIFSGGDGTFNDIARGVASQSVRPPLGYIPTGTANDNARNLGIKRNVKKAVKTIISGKTIKHDVGMINDDYFMYALAMGACTKTPYTTEHKAKKILGRLAYVGNGINEFFTTPLSFVKVVTENDSLDIECPLLLVMNSKSVGGISFNRYGHLNDGTFDIIIIKDDTSRGRINILSTFIYGLFGKKWKKGAIFLTSSEFTIDVPDDVTWCVDGQKGPNGKITVKNLKGHLEIFVPKGKKKGEKDV